MCHNLWSKHTCGHKGAYIRYVQYKYYKNTLEILAKVRTANLELKMRMNERLCKLDHAKIEFGVTNGLCKLCKAV